MSGAPVPFLHLDATECARKGGRSGIPRMVRELARALREAGAAVEPVVWDEAARRFAPPHAFQRRNLDPSPSRPLRRQRATVPLWQRAWSALARPFRPDAERGFGRGWIVLAETFRDGRIEWLERFPRGGAPWRRAAIFYDAICLTHPEWIPARNRGRFEAYLASLSHCDLVFCISRQSEDDLRGFWAARGLDPAPTEVILPPATDLVRLAPEAEPAAPSGVPEVLYVATLEPRKNHLALLQACERLWDGGAAFRLVLVGQGLRSGSEAILDAIERCRAAGRPLDWRREIDDRALAGLYRRCAFTAYPSLKEGFGLPILESLAYGKACVCHRFGAIAEAAEGGGCLQVDVADPDALAGAIGRLLSPEARRPYEEEAAARTFRTWRDYAGTFLARMAG